MEDFLVDFKENLQLSNRKQSKSIELNATQFSARKTEKYYCCRAHWPYRIQIASIT